MRSVSSPLPHQGVVTTTTAQHVGAAGTVEQVIAEATDEALGFTGAVQGVVAAAALLRDVAGEFAAEDHITCAAVDAIRVGAMCAHHEVIKTIAIDVASGADGAAAAVIRRASVEAEAVRAIEAVEIE
jgi:hypothetical protein